ncbi:MAG: DUF523 domain-containing protein [Lachnospiraceae bacterium]|nr:DUF523 domain-containing protein [Lachnospiraceae bacterium]
MKILVSSCLMGENCKYNGGNNFTGAVAALAKEHEIITVCPEVLGGLSTPRVPAEIGSDGIVYSRDGKNVDAEFRLGAKKALEIAMRERPDLCILKSRSPSCGVHQHYNGTFSGVLTDGPGVTAQLLTEHGFRCIEPEEIEAGVQL